MANPNTVIKYTWNVPFLSKPNGQVTMVAPSAIIGSSESEAKRNLLAWYKMLHEAYKFAFSSETRIQTPEEFKTQLDATNPVTKQIVLTRELCIEHDRLINSLKGYQV